LKLEIRGWPQDDWENEGEDDLQSVILSTNKNNTEDLAKKREAMGMTPEGIASLINHP
jgi:hypothetical protein